jgi:hypothetical protein
MGLKATESFQLQLDASSSDTLGEKLDKIISQGEPIKQLKAAAKSCVERLAEATNRNRSKVKREAKTILVRIITGAGGGDSEREERALRVRFSCHIQIEIEI